MKKVANGSFSQRIIRVAVAALALGFATGGLASGLDLFHNTPGHKYLEAAQRSYENGYYGMALTNFRRAARRADKLAQHNIGVMHYLGQSVDADPARAWAWFELAAERRYPRFVQIANQVWNELDDAQRRNAMDILENELEGSFGDAYVVERVARQMERDQRRSTGSRLGFASPFLTVIESSGSISINNETYSMTMRNATPMPGTVFYAPARWDFYGLLHLEGILFDAEERGQVNIGEFQVVEPDNN